MLSYLNDYYPPVSFYFIVGISGIIHPNDFAFQEVSGLSQEITTKDQAEGGENRFKHQLPIASGSKNKLVLKRGLISLNSQLGYWVRQTTESDFSKAIEPKDMLVSLLDEYGLPKRTWNIVNAWPTKWEVSSFDSMKNEAAIETMEFNYNYFVRVL